MNQPNILVCVDTSPWSLRAIDTAMAFAQDLAANLHILHVLASEDDRTREKSWLEELKHRLNGRPVELHLVVGEPVEQILMKSRELPELLMTVIATHGETGDLAQLMGHVAWEVIQQADFPVLLTRKNMTIPLHLKHILIPLDGSPPPAEVVPFAVKLAERSGAELIFYHVVGVLAKVKGQEGSMAPPRYMDHPSHAWESWEHEFMERFFQPGRYANATFPVKLYMGHGGPATAILQFLNDHPIDLMAVGWKGQPETSRITIFRSLIKDSPCPIMLYRATSAE